MWACLAVGIHERANQDSPKTDISALRQSRHKQRIYLLSHVLSALCFSWNCHIKECVRSCVCVWGVTVLYRGEAVGILVGGCCQLRSDLFFCGCFVVVVVVVVWVMGKLFPYSHLGQWHERVTGGPEVSYTESQYMVDTSQKKGLAIAGDNMMTPISNHKQCPNHLNSFQKTDSEVQMQH